MIKRNHAGCERGFVWTSRAWYADTALEPNDGIADDIQIGHYDPQGGTTGEFSIRWHWLAGTWTPRLEAFDDSWDTLYCCSDLLHELSFHDSDDPSPLHVVEILTNLGFEDYTPYTKE